VCLRRQHALAAVDLCALILQTFENAHIYNMYFTTGAFYNGYVLQRMHFTLHLILQRIHEQRTDV
jgi:hypothetical protein